MLMKKLLFVCLVLTLVSCKQDKDGITTDIIKNPKSASGEVVDIDELPIMEFKTDRIEFGDISQGEKITREFEFTNTGKSDLIIEDVSGACGCTVAKDWPREPVKPGGSGKFSVTFESGRMVGQQVKQITVKANTYPSSNVVALAGNVLEPTKK
jgi:hypothetical protein